ncbi:Pentafunctional AROM polypeptide [Talaromyces islandicus]|uniref:Pentafunctional AROM polypeptide n=1 Tax=Talaromyces islandicus TaxID=28573 RepID=A0A0U1LL57_TALIS|nr:Pentafunctional AROM polypeptide [Talaromyces islandicus]
MDIDPRLQSANDRLNKDSASPRDRYHPRQPQHHHHLSYTNISRADGPAAAVKVGSDHHVSPDSSHSQVPGSTPSPHDEHAHNVGEFGDYLNEMSIGFNDGRDDPLADLKRPRACEACRQLKVRCELDSDHPSGSCKRCAKAKRTCVITAPSRKRQKKTDSRVTELEKKIDALTASLQASRRAASAFSDEGAHEQEAVPPRRWLGGGPPPQTSYPSSGNSPAPATKRTAGGDIKPTSKVNASYSSGLFAPFGRDDSSEANEGTASWPQTQGQFSGNANEYADLIDRGVIDVETATKSFDRYVNEISPTLPIVVFPPGTTMSSVRRDKPILFLVIMSVSISPFRPELQMPLTNEVHRLFADKVVIRGEKTLELVQAIVLSCTWYNPPDHFEELKFFPFIYMAVVMALDIGMGRVTRRKGNKQLGMLREILGKNRGSMDPDSVDTRRAWLGAYFLAVNASMALRRPLLCRWHPYMDECIDILQNSRDALPSDKVLIHWAKLSHIAEEVGFQFSMDDPSNSAFLTDAKVQFALKGFENQLDQWRREIAPENYTLLLRHAESILNIYMHEISMHTEHNFDDFKPPYRGFSDDTKITNVTAAQVDALTVCLTSIHNSMDIITSFDHDTIVCLPTVYFARTAYGFVALLKMLSAISQDNGLGQVFSLDDLKAEQYLDKVITHLKISGGKPGGRTAGKFCMILNLLKNWFVNRKSEKSKTKTGHAQGDKSHAPTVLPPITEIGTESSQSTSAPPASLVGIAPSGGLSSGETPTTTTQQWPQFNPATSATASTFMPPQGFDMAAAQQPTANFGDATNPMMTGMMADASQAEFAGFAPELGLQMPFDPEGLFSIGNMLHDGIFNMPIDDEDADVEASTLACLKDTKFACSALKRLNGGTANFVYSGQLLSSQDTKPEEVIVKHTTDYVALNREFKLDRERSVFEETMLRALNTFAPVRDNLLSPSITVRTPRLYHYDSETHTQVMEHLPGSKDLKSWLLSENGGKSISQGSARAIGHALGAWIGAFHAWASQELQTVLRKTMAKNREMQKLKYMVNYEKLATMVDTYPHILESSRAIFEQARDCAAAEISSGSSLASTQNGDYGLIHGDFWTGNVLITDHTLFVVDWELSHLGLRALDLGQMLAELFEAKHFKDIDAGVWIMQGLIEKYELLTLDMAFRAATHVGVHLVCWSGVPGWGTQQQIEDVVRIGRDFIVKGWQRDRDWFVDEGTLAFLFERDH